MDRRTFLRQLGFGTVSAAAAALTWDVERLLWVPGEKTIFLPRHIRIRPSDEQLIREAAKRLADAIDADILERVYAQQDLRFWAGGVWPESPPRQIRTPQRFVVEQGH